MSESPKPRFAVDLNDLERQLAQSGAPTAPVSRNDPLAELARIVGQDDPFQSILANDGSARPRQQASAIDDLFATRDPVMPAPRAPQARAQRSSHEMPGAHLDPYPQAAAHRAHSGYAYQSASSAPHDEEGYSQGYYDENAQHYAVADYGQPERLDYPSVAKRRSSKGRIAVGAVLGAIVIGGGGAYMLGGSSSTSDGAPPLIKAASEPIKVQPKNPGGVEIPNQNKQIYERANQTETKVVNREEQPVDVEQAVRMNGGVTADAMGGTASAAPAQSRQPAYSLNLGEPRKVRTVAIRPDGTVVQPEGSQPRSSAVPTMTLPAEARPAAPSAPNPVRAASTQSKPVASAPAAAAAAPAPTPVAAAPASGSLPQRVASAQPVSITPPTVEPEIVPTGDYAVQLGLAKTESGAETAFEQFQRKYSDLEGLPSLIRQTELNGNTVYRVRVGPMSREEASSLCSKLQGQGGQCFVAKNN